MSEVIIDVRERDEYAIEYIKDSINVPLSVFSMVAPGVLNQLKDRKIMFMCHSGVRSAQAKNLAAGLGYDNEHEYSFYEGGMLNWIKSGNNVAKGHSKSTLSIQRQVQLILGVMLVVSMELGYLYNPWFAAVAALIGGGLFVAGVTGYCLAAEIVSILPWNKAAAAKPADPSVEA